MIGNELSIAPVADPVSDPRSPAEAKRHWMIDRLWASSVMSYLATAAIIAIIWLGVWPAAVAGQRLNILGAAALLFIARQIIVDWSFSIGGPVGRWKARWGNNEMSATGDAAGSDDLIDAAYDSGEITRVS